MDFKKLAEIAIEAALAAGKIIQEHMNFDVAFEVKNEGTNLASQVVTEVDRKCENVILSYLRSSVENYDLAVLTEETADDGSRFEKEYFWCIDPMDGTLPFINKQPGFSVSIALVSKDGTPKVGVVFDPSTNNLFHAISGKGAFKNRLEWKIKNSNNHLTYVTDKKLKDTPQADKIRAIIANKAKELLLTEVIELSGAGSVLNAITVVEHSPAFFLKLPKNEEGGGSIWDFAATACIFAELGLISTNSYGERLELNKKNGTFMNEKGILYSSI